MTLTIDLKPEMEAALREEAAKAGLAADHFAQRTLEERLKQPVNGRSDVPHLSYEESDLLQKINQGLPTETWEKYDVLREKFRAETLTPEEHAELIAISNQIEIAHARRMEYLVELSRLRQVPLRKLMKQLGIVSPGYV
jgi:hypothetical protein